MSNKFFGFIRKAFKGNESSEEEVGGITDEQLEHLLFLEERSRRLKAKSEYFDELFEILEGDDEEAELRLPETEEEEEFFDELLAMLSEDSDDSEIEEPLAMFSEDSDDSDNIEELEHNYLAEWLSTEITQDNIDRIREEAEDALDHLIKTGIPDVYRPEEYHLRDELMAMKYDIEMATDIILDGIPHDISMLNSLFGIEVEGEFVYNVEIVQNSSRFTSLGFFIGDEVFDIYAYILDAYGWDIKEFFERAEEHLKPLGSYFIQRILQTSTMRDYTEIQRIEAAAKGFSQQLEDFNVLDDRFKFRQHFGASPAVTALGTERPLAHVTITSPFGAFAITTFNFEESEEYEIRISADGIPSRKPINSDEWEEGNKLGELSDLRTQEIEEFMNGATASTDSRYVNFKSLFVVPAGHRIIENHSELDFIPIDQLKQYITGFEETYSDEFVEVIDRIVGRWNLINNTYQYINYHREYIDLVHALTPIDNALFEVFHLMDYDEWLLNNQ